MQHADVAITVDTQQCADAILDSIMVIRRCWVNTARNQFADWIKCSLKIVELYSSKGDPNRRNSFENEMMRENWRGEGSQNVRVNEMTISPGQRGYWLFAVKYHTPLVVECFDKAGVN